MKLKKPGRFEFNSSRSHIKEPSIADINEQLNEHPYINFHQYTFQGINLTS